MGASHDVRRSQTRAGRLLLIMSSATPADVFLASQLGASLSAEQLGQQLAAMPDWESRYQAVIDLGGCNPALNADDKIDINLLHGCQATVWVVHFFDTDSGLLYFLCDSDSRLVRGLLACLLCLYSAKTPADVLATDARPWMERVGLLRHLASTRSNGLWAMIGKIKAVASRY